MGRLALYIFLFIHICSSLMAQSEYHLIFEAQKSYCAGDTISAIRQLKAQVDRYPNATNLEAILFVLGKTCLQIGDTAAAKRYFDKAFAIESSKSPMVIIQDTCGLFEGSFYSYNWIKAETCVALSRIAAHNKKYDVALNLLARAEGDFQPFRDCGNGILMYRSNRSFDYAKVYLAKGDTLAAQQRLLEYFDCRDGNYLQVTTMLKDLLLMRHTAKEITAVFQTAINNIKKDEAGNSICIISGLGMKRTITFRDENPEKLRAHLKNDPAWKIMLE
jgi:tetratricopeptide (TPR) repeat protein